MDTKYTFNGYLIQIDTEEISFGFYGAAQYVSIYYVVATNYLNFCCCCYCSLNVIEYFQVTVLISMLMNQICFKV